MPSVDLSGGSSSPTPDLGQGGGAGGYGGGNHPYGGTPGQGAGGYGGGGAAGGLGGFGQNAAADYMKDAAYQQAQSGLQAATTGAGTAILELRKYVQEGPAGVSMLCFLGGLATIFAGFIGLLNLGGLASPFHYVLNAYLFVFGVVTVLLEADMESFKQMSFLGRFAPFVEQYQKEVFQRANFLTQLRGRGFFFLFVGSLAITQCFFCLFFVVGVWNVLMGVLCLLMSFGINPANHMNVAVQPTEQHLLQNRPYP